MKIITAFFMAWGNFITIPCPYKRWDNNLKNLMLAFLPSVGVVVGLVWCLVYGLMEWGFGIFNIPVMLKAFVMELVIFYVCGFMHMDGFMDCNDAIMSRRDLAERQRILKDSTVGAFAALTAIFLMLGWFASLVSVYNMLDFGVLLLIPVMSRSVGGLGVLYYKPIGHSQYAQDFKAPSKWKYRSVIGIQMVIVLLAAFFLSGNKVSIIVIAAVMEAAGFIACAYARKQLGGMSGDVAGYTICVSEIAGIITAAVIL